MVIWLEATLLYKGYKNGCQFCCCCFLNILDDGNPTGYQNDFLHTSETGHPPRLVAGKPRGKPAPSHCQMAEGGQSQLGAWEESVIYRTAVEPI